jgi:hypothetical protein
MWMDQGSAIWGSACVVVQWSFECCAPAVEELGLPVVWYKWSRMLASTADPAAIHVLDSLPRKMSRIHTVNT